MQKNSWQRKNKILNKNTELYVNISNLFLSQNIFEAKIDNNSKWKKKIINTLTQNYSRHPYFELIEELIITELESKKIIYISDLNTRIIRKISKNLSIDVDFKNDYDYDFTEKNQKN